MLVDEINELWDARPFCPFEIAMSNGENYTATSPKLMLMSPSMRTLHLVTPEGRSIFLSVSQMNRVAIKDVDQAGAPAPVERK